LIYEFHFQRQGIIDINAAVVGISRSRWTAATPTDASIEHAQKIMRANGFDVLPIDDGWRVREYFNTREWGVYTSIEQKPITYRDVISYQAPIRGVIKGFAAENRNLYFLGQYFAAVRFVHTRRRSADSHRGDDACKGQSSRTGRASSPPHLSTILRSLCIR
jgi:hypothetical protein